MKILVRTHCFLGDFICAEPSLRAICKKHPNDEIIVQTIFGSFLKWYPYPIRIVRNPVPCDMEYNLICDGNGHLVRKVAEQNNLDLDSDIPGLNIPIDEPTRADYHVVCAEASTTERQWDQKSWESLVDILEEPVVQVGKWKNVKISNADPSLLGIAMQPKELATLIFHAKTFITVDTGLSHFAASIKKPYIVLMHTVPMEWRMHEGYTIPIHKKGIEKITVQDILSCIKK